MILCDTGPLLALIDQDDPWHARCVAWYTPPKKIEKKRFALVATWLFQKNMGDEHTRRNPRSRLRSAGGLRMR